MSNKPGQKMAQTLAAVQQEHPEASVQAWAEDEHRIGLHPVNRLIWVPRGEAPQACVNWRYQWLWLVGFVQPTTGETYWWIVPYLNWQVFSQLLTDFAQHLGLLMQKTLEEQS
jgi:hypothetical protein